MAGGPVSSIRRDGKLRRCLCAILLASSDGCQLMADARTLTVIPNQALPTSAQVLSSEAVLDELKMILTDAPLNEVLISVARLIEGHSDGVERERSQAALRLAFDEIKTSEGQLRQTVDAIPQTIVVLGADGSTVYANRTVLDYVGYSADELMESDFRERVFHAEDFERLRETRRNGFSGRVQWENEIRVRRNDGQYRWFLIRYNPIFDERDHLIR